VTPTAFNVAGHVVQPAADGGDPHHPRQPGDRPESSFTCRRRRGRLRAEHGLDADATYFRTRVRDRITTRQTTTPKGDRCPTARRS
jgi:hypothetical protein